MDIYAKHPYEDLTDLQLDSLLNEVGIPFAVENAQGIQRRLAKKKSNYPVRRTIMKKWLIPLVAVMALMLVGFAKRDVVAQLFMDVFGNRDIGQYAEPLSGSSTDGGIRMELLSGVHDSNSTYLFVSLTDETGTHNLENLSIMPEEWTLSGYGGLYGANCRMVQYDEQTRSAILLVHGVGGGAGKSATFNLTSFGGGETVFDFTVPDIDLAQLVTDAHAVFVPFDGRHAGMGISDPDVKVEAALEKGELGVVIPDFDRTQLSNIGYRDGFLHIQFDSMYDSSNERITPYLLNPDTGDAIHSAYSTNYDATLDYQESAFRIEDKQTLEDYVLCLEGWYYADTISGNWEVRFVIPQQMQDAVEVLDEPVSVDGFVIDSIKLSPMNITLSGTIPPELSVGVVVEYKDGTTKTMTYLRDNAWLPFGGNTPDDTASTNVTFMHPIIDFEDVVAITINDLRIPI